LKLYEQALVGIQLRAVDVLGSFDGSLHYSPLPAGSAEVDLEEDILAGYRINDQAQVGVTVPIVETWRSDPGIPPELGGSIGDITVHARYDFILAANAKGIPGISVVGAITAPSGRTPTEAKTPLSVDATGTGYWQGALGLGLQQLFGPWVLDVGLSLWGALPQTIGTITEALGPQISGRLAWGYSFHSGLALAVTLVYRGATAAYLNHEPVPDAPGLMTAGLALGWPINYQWRLQAAASDDLPVLGRSHVAGVGATLTILRTF
jgi:hypothetical protein